MPYGFFKEPHFRTSFRFLELSKVAYFEPYTFKILFFFVPFETKNNCFGFNFKNFKQSDFFPFQIRFVSISFIVHQ